MTTACVLTGGLVFVCCCVGFCNGGGCSGAFAVALFGVSVLEETLLVVGLGWRTVLAETLFVVGPGRLGSEIWVAACGLAEFEYRWGLVVYLNAGAEVGYRSP